MTTVPPPDQSPPQADVRSVVPHQLITAEWGTSVAADLSELWAAVGQFPTVGPPGPQGPPGTVNGVLNVMDFGAKGDGITDDSAAITAALNVASAAGAGTVTAPGDKTFGIGAVWPVLNQTGRITVDLNGATLQPLAGATVLFEVAGKGSSMVRFRNVCLYGTSAVGSVGLRLTNCQTVTVEDVRCRNLETGVDMVTAATPGNPWTEQNSLERVEVLSCGTGIVMRAAGGNSSFAGNRMHDVQTGDCDIGIDVRAGAVWYGGRADGLCLFVSKAGSPVGINVAGSVLATRLSGRMETTSANTPLAMTVAGSVTRTLIDFMLTGSFQDPPVANTGGTVPAELTLAGSGAQSQARIALDTVSITNFSAAINTYGLSQPVSPVAGQMWTEPTLGHTAQWTGTAWRPVTPATAGANICCVIGAFDWWFDAEGAAVGAASVTSSGRVATNTMTLTAATVATDGSARRCVVFDGTTAYGTISAGSSIDATESFTALLIASQPSFASVAGQQAFGNSTSSTTASWRLFDGTTPAQAGFRVRTGSSTSTVATSAVNRTAGAIYTALGWWTPSTAAVSVDGETPVTAAGALTGPFYSGQAARVARTSGSTNTFTAMTMYVAGMVKRVLTTTERQTIDTWRSVRFMGAAAPAAPVAPVRRTIKADTTTAYAPILTDENQMITLSNAAAITVTLPSNATQAFPVGAEVDFLWLGVGQPTFAAGSGATVAGTPGLKLRAQYSAATAKCIAASTWVIIGDLA